MDLVVTVAFVALVIAAAVGARRAAMAAGHKKSAILKALNGHQVNLGVAAGGEKVIHHLRGRLVVDDDDASIVVLSAESDVVVPVDRVSQIIDIDSGRRYGHWWRSDPL